MARPEQITLARRLLSDLAEMSEDLPGVTREAYGVREQRAHDLIREEAERLGCVVHVDAVGKLYMTHSGGGSEPQALLVGSHLDSVPHGGNFDGAAGVVAGLCLIAELLEQSIACPFDITVVAFRAEEAAWFPTSYPGSSAAVGRLTAEALRARRVNTGLTLSEHIVKAGFDPKPAEASQPLIALDKVSAYLEVHIEQGPALVAAGVAVGVVTGLAGGLRFANARIKGAYSHSGATPRRHRHDAVVAFADLVAHLETAWDEIEAAGQEATITIGKVATNSSQHAASKVAGEIEFSLDIRSANQSVLDDLRARASAIATTTSSVRGVQIDLGPNFAWSAVSMTPDLIAELQMAADAQGIPVLVMPSGAGHDAAVLAEAGVPTAMLFVRNENGSHNPDEAMDLADLGQAVAILVAFVKRRAGL